MFGLWFLTLALRLAVVTNTTPQLEGSPATAAPYTQTSPQLPPGVILDDGAPF